MALSLGNVLKFNFRKNVHKFCAAISTRSLQTSKQSQNGSLTVSTQENGIRKITLNNPKKRNALSLAMLESLQNDVVENVSDPELRVIVINGNGPVFSAGHDLSELTSAQSREHHELVFKKCTEVMTLLQDAPVPVIAEVRGLATAAGCQLVATCDIAIATESAKFATPGLSVGLFCSTPGIAVARAVPRKVAMEMLFTGQPITAQEALRHGLVSRVVAEEQLETEVMRIARRICEFSRSVNTVGKRFFYRQIELSRDQAYQEGGQVMVNNLAMTDGREGIQSFLEKRPPRWTDIDDYGEKY